MGRPHKTRRSAAGEMSRRSSAVCRSSTPAPRGSGDAAGRPPAASHRASAVRRHRPPARSAARPYKTSRIVIDMLILIDHLHHCVGNRTARSCAPTHRKTWPGVTLSPDDLAPSGPIICVVHTELIMVTLTAFASPVRRLVALIPLAFILVSLTSCAGPGTLLGPPYDGPTAAWGYNVP
jgi:hypothetical protein